MKTRVTGELNTHRESSEDSGTAAWAILASWRVIDAGSVKAARFCSAAAGLALPALMLALSRLQSLHCKHKLGKPPCTPTAGSHSGGQPGPSQGSGAAAAAAATAGAGAGGLARWALGSWPGFHFQPGARVKRKQSAKGGDQAFSPTGAPQER